MSEIKFPTSGDIYLEADGVRIAAAAAAGQNTAHDHQDGQEHCNRLFHNLSLFFFCFYLRPLVQAGENIK
jgi:hypothetical protein